MNDSWPSLPVVGFPSLRPPAHFACRMFLFRFVRVFCVRVVVLPLHELVASTPTC